MTQSINTQHVLDTAYRATDSVSPTIAHQIAYATLCALIECCHYTESIEGESCIRIADIAKITRETRDVIDGFKT
jgi:hypothetical protein